MGGILEDDLSRPYNKSNYILSPRVLQKRFVALLTIFSIFITGLFVTSGGLRDDCGHGSLCSMSRLHPTAFKPFGTQQHRYDHGPSRIVPSRTKSPSLSHALGSDCLEFPDTSRVLLVMKTGATELYSKVPNQIMASLKCLPEFFIFSDKAQKVAGYTVYDSLDNITSEIKHKNNDFELYDRQQSCPVDQTACNKHHEASRQGWNLDKYKNIHMAEKAYAMRPDYDWYLFVDADTYVFWPTLTQWLDKLDPTEARYIGSLAYIDGFPFGHGGSGYLLSQAAMKQFFHEKGNVANRWEERISKECCGDYVFSIALKNETDVGIENAWPTINGEKPYTIPYSPKEWCQPIATMHHVSAEEVSDIYAFEKERGFDKAMRIKDLYHRFVKERMVARRDNWDNLSEKVYYLDPSSYPYADWELSRAKTEDLSDLEKRAHKSFEDCRRACYSLDQCFQFRFHHGICSVSYNFKLGYPTKIEKEEDEHWSYQSGWNLEKIERWIEEHDKCDDVDFALKAGMRALEYFGPEIR
ncbi:hypothetical protein HIM_00059 [Hirsutella minnesotensis 3608]|nr:hypothetical protein HIM_00059 [Hirsutella minnesotensis 3608]